MSNFTLKLEENGMYAAYENGKRVKNAIFSGVADFENELKALGFNKPYTVTLG